MTDLITPEYQALLQQKHAGKPWGGAGASWIPEIVRLMIKYKLRSEDAGVRGRPPRILDYGAGRSTFQNTMEWLMPHVVVSEYDPGVKGIDQWPPMDFWAKEKYDLVLCTDVMEHVEEQFVLDTFRRIREVTGLSALFNIACNASKSLLPDGRNTHLTIHGPEWWENQVMRVFPEIQILPEYKGLYVCRKA